MAKVAWTDDAVRHLVEIAAYVRQFNPMAADKLSARLIDAGESLSAFPGRGRPGQSNQRELPGVPSYVIHYRTHGDDVVILAILHGARRRMERS